MQVDNKIKTIKEFLEDKKTLMELLGGSNCDWSALGFMEGLDETSAAALASKLNEIVKILLHSNFVFDKRLDGLMIPIVCRAFKSYGHLVIDCLAAINYVNSKIDALPENWEYNSIDLEAEFCNLMAEEIANLKL
jgi:hypothetical protein